jgi:hypothetical protein
MKFYKVNTWRGAGRYHEAGRYQDATTYHKLQFWQHMGKFIHSDGRCGIFVPTSVEPFRHYIDAFLDALDRAEVPEEEWP